MAPNDGGRWWTVPVNVAATGAWRLPGALMGGVLSVAAGSMLGPAGLLLALVWLVAGLVTLSRFGERLLARTVLRYRPAPGSWLQAEVRRLLPGRRVDVYVARKTSSGVFALGGHTIGLGEASIGACAPTHPSWWPLPPRPTNCATGPTRPELPLIWWAAPWGIVKQIPRHLLPPRWQPLIKVWAICVVVASIVNSVHDDHPSATVLTVCAVTDLCITYVHGGRQRRRVHNQLQAARACLLTPEGSAGSGGTHGSRWCDQ